MTRVRAWSCAGVATLLAGATLWAGAGAAGADTTVSTESELRAALADPSTTTVTLGASIPLTDCSAGGGDLDRDGALTLDGGGFTITQTCPGERVLQSTSGTLTLEHVTITGGDQTATIDPTSVLGGGVRAANDLVLDDTTVTGNTVSGNATFSALTAGAFGGGVEADGAITVMGSHVDANTARNAGSYGAGILGGAGQDVTITDSSVDRNVSEAADPAAQYGSANGGGVALVANHASTSTILTPAGTVHLVRSSANGNVERPTATDLAFAVGGGVFAGDVDLQSSHVDANEQRPVTTGNQAGTDQAVGWGGGVLATALTANGSTIDRNIAAPVGDQEATEGAGAWAVSDGALVLTDSTVRGNSGQTGTTGVSNCAGVVGASLTLIGTVVSGNQGSGQSAVGGGACADTATIDSSTISGNSVTGTTGHSYGGGAVVGSGTVRSSTISGNSVSDTDAHGGGLVHELFGGGAAGNLALVDSTVTGNTATGAGTSSAGGIEQLHDATQGNTGPVSLVFSTIAGNSAATGANFGNSSDTDPVTSFASTISAPLGGGTNCAGFALGDQGNTQVTDTSCGTMASADPQLGALADNGGPTATMLPSTTSPLLGQVPTAACTAKVTTDQRGVVRPQGAACAVGAVEVAAPVTPVDPPLSPSGTGVSPTDATAATPVVAKPNFTG